MNDQESEHDGKSSRKEKKLHPGDSYYKTPDPQYGVEGRIAGDTSEPSKGIKTRIWIFMNSGETRKKILKAYMETKDLLADLWRGDRTIEDILDEEGD